MQVASIVPNGNLDLIEDDSYHMALAHLVSDDAVYREFYFEQSKRGSFVMMDNGVVETGVPMDMSDLIRLGRLIGASEVILPDAIRNSAKTLELGRHALDAAIASGRGVGLLAVPHGRTAEEWSGCAKVMSAWPVDAIGISRFAPAPRGRLGLRGRWGLLTIEGGRWIRGSGKAIHLLGCGGVIGEAGVIDALWPRRIRGTDSGVATMATSEGVRLEIGGKRSRARLDTRVRVDPTLLAENLRVWRWSCSALSCEEEVQAWAK